MDITIQRHAVGRQRNGMSEFQQQLLEHPAPVRLASAPTGAGKSYAFLKAVLLGQRVLFVVPTRRLAHNLIQSLQQDMRREDWSEEQINNKIALWTSDGRDFEVAQGVKNVTRKRLKQITELSPRVGGEIIVATPESVAWLILDPHRSPITHYSDRSILDVVADFDHLVFDEMHTIESRGLGLSFVLAWLCCHYPKWNTKLTYLSATPVDLQAALAEFGILPQYLAVLSERIFDLDVDEPVAEQQRVIHGDVALVLHPQQSLLELVQKHGAEIYQEVAEGRQVVLIYDRLFDGLSKQLQSMQQALEAIGIASERVLRISSADDSEQGSGGGHCDFKAGRRYVPEDFSVLVATSSIEMGVTFNCRLLLMEAGHNPSSFAQRIGRAARGDIQGSVLVALEQQAIQRHTWLRDLMAFVQERQGQRVSINVLMQRLTGEYQVSEKANNQPVGMFAEAQMMNWFDHMPNRAALNAGLVWHYFREHHGLKGPRRELLNQHQPPVMKRVYDLLLPLFELKNHPDYGDTFNEWHKQFKLEVFLQRTIGQQVIVKAPNENAQWRLPLIGLKRHTDILERYMIERDQQGHWQVCIDESHWRQTLQNEAKSWHPQQGLLLPHDGRLLPIPKGETALQHLKKVVVQLRYRQPDVVVTALDALLKISTQTKLLCLTDLD